ncbi:MAG: FAD-binding oxidoreductase [Dehalococcoidia bacterium]|nr:FAD-binding oxidoreductase [Dehalococcoidia bacterium]
MEAVASENIVKGLAEIVGEKYVRADDVIRWTYAIEDFAGSFFHPLSDKYGPPDIVVKPHSAEEVSKILKLANTHKIPIIARGGGSDMTGAATPLKKTGGIILDMTDMNRVLDFQEGLNAVRVQPGIRWGELHHELAKKGITAGCQGPHGFLGATLGGCIGGNCFSINSPKYGWLNENILNLQVVLPNGDIIETGSLANTMVKDWYYRYCNGPDLVGIFLGAAGAFGVITEFTLRTYPIPEFSDTLAYTFPDTDSQIKFVFKLEWHGYVTDLWGLAYYTLPDSLKKIIKPLVGERDIAIFATEAYDKDIFKAQKKAIDKMAKEFGGIALPVEGLTRALGISIINQTEWMGGGTFGKVMGPNGCDTCSIAHLPQWQKVVGSALEIMYRDEDALSGSIPLIGAEHFFLFAQLLCRGGVANTFAMTPGDFMNPEKLKQAQDMYCEIVESYMDTGYAALYRIGKESQFLTKRFKPEYISFMKAIKKTLDPNNIMNPGVHGLGLEEE